MALFKAIAKICACYVAIFFIFRIASAAYRIYFKEQYIGASLAGILFGISVAIIMFCYSIHQLSRALDLKFITNRYTNAIARSMSLLLVLNILVTTRTHSVLQLSIILSIICIEAYWWRK